MQMRLAIMIFLLCAPSTNVSGQNAPVEAGSVSGNTYVNTELGFRYEFPAGWSVNKPATIAKEVALGRQIEWHADTFTKNGNQSTSLCTKNLLFATQHAPEMQLTSPDSSLLLIAIDPSCIPGATFPAVPDDREGVQRTANQIVSRLKTENAARRGLSRIRAFDKGGRVMLEVSQPLIASEHEHGTTTAQSIYSSFVLMNAGRYWLMWWLTSDTDYNLEKLQATKVVFDAVRTTP